MTDATRTIEVGSPGAPLPSGAVVGAEPGPNGLVVEFAARTVTFNLEWLRDNCPCDECRIVQTDERRWQPWLDTTGGAISRADVVAGDLHVDWASGHQSVFASDIWAGIERATRRGTYGARLWVTGHELDRFDHDRAVSDPVTQRGLYESFLRDGAVVITDAPVIPGTVIDVLKALRLTVRDSSLGLIFDVKVDPDGYNVAFTNEGVPPHNDNAQYTQPPSGQVLAMLVNDATGGESIVVDGWNVLEQLNGIDPAAIDVLSRVGVQHRQYSVTAEGFSRTPLVVRDQSGHFRHLRFSNQLRQPLPYDHPDLAEWYRAYRQLATLITDPANHMSFRLRAGDMLFVNGMRILHSRRAFLTDGARHLQDVYFDVDDVVGNLARLTGDATNAMVSS